MRHSWKLVVSVLAIGFMGCAGRTETFNQADMVNVSKNEDSNQKLTDLGRKKRSNRSSNRVDEENSSTPEK